MSKAFHAAWVYTALGLLAGLFYRTYTQAKDFEGATQLSVVHTHLLALGTLFFLIVLGLCAVLPLAEQGWFAGFYWLYNAGVGLTIGTMVVRGVVQANGNTDDLPALAGVAGLGHMLITAAFVVFFLVLKGAVEQHRTRVSPGGAAAPQ